MKNFIMPLSAVLLFNVCAARLAAGSKEADKNMASRAPRTAPLSPMVRAALPAVNSCSQIKVLSPEALPPGLVDQALAEGQRSGDSVCLAHVAEVLVNQNNCDTAYKIAQQAVRQSASEPLAQLVLARSRACQLTRQTTAGLTGGPASCDERELANIAQGLAQGGLLDTTPHAAVIAAATLESLARVCRDDQRLLLPVLDLLAQRGAGVKSCPAERHTEEAQGVRGEKTPLGLTGYALRCQFEEAIGGSRALPSTSLRLQARLYLAEALHEEARCLARADAGCRIAAEAMLLADRALVSHPDLAPNFGLVLEDLLYLARAGGLHTRGVLVRAAAAFPFWSVRAPQAPEELRPIKDLLRHLEQERGYIGGALLALKLELVLIFSTPVEPCRQAEAIHKSIGRFAAASHQAKPEEWGADVRAMAIGGLRLANVCPTAMELAQRFREIESALKEAPMLNPFIHDITYSQQ